MLGQPRPEHPGLRVGQRHGRNVGPAPFSQTMDPGAAGILLTAGVLHDRACPMNEPFSPVAVAPLAEAEPHNLAAAGWLFGCQAEPGGKLTAAVKHLGITHRRPYGGGGERPHPLDLAPALANLILARQAFQTLVMVLDLGLDLLKPLIPLMQQRPTQVRQPILGVL